MSLTSLCRHMFVLQSRALPLKPTRCHYCQHMVWVMQKDVRSCTQCGITLHQQCFTEMQQHQARSWDAVTAQSQSQEKGFRPSAAAGGGGGRDKQQQPKAVDLAADDVDDVDESPSSTSSSVGEGGGDAGCGRRPNDNRNASAGVSSTFDVVTPEEVAKLTAPHQTSAYFAHQHQFARSPPVLQSVTATFLRKQDVGPSSLFETCIVCQEIILPSSSPSSSNERTSSHQKKKQQQKEKEQKAAKTEAKGIDGGESVGAVYTAPSPMDPVNDFHATAAANTSSNSSSSSATSSDDDHDEELKEQKGNVRDKREAHKKEKAAAEEEDDGWPWGYHCLSCNAHVHHHCYRGALARDSDMVPDEQAAAIRRANSATDPNESHAIASTMDLMNLLQRRNRHWAFGVVNPLLLYEMNQKHEQLYAASCASLKEIAPSSWTTGGGRGASSTSVGAWTVPVVQDALRFATAVYGAPYHEGFMTSCVGSVAMRFLRRDLLSAPTWEHVGSIADTLGLPRSAVKHASLSTNVFQPSYAIVVDHNVKKIVVAFRGSLSDADFLTDLVGTVRHFAAEEELEEEGGYEVATTTTATESSVEDPTRTINEPEKETEGGGSAATAAVAHRGMAIMVEGLWHAVDDVVTEVNAQLPHQEALRNEEEEETDPLPSSDAIPSNQSSVSQEQEGPVSDGLPPAAAAAMDPAAPQKVYDDELKLLRVLTAEVERNVGYDVLITGHSLGGGLAQLFGTKLIAAVRRRQRRHPPPSPEAVVSPSSNPPTATTTTSMSAAASLTVSTREHLLNTLASHLTVAPSPSSSPSSTIMTGTRGRLHVVAFAPPPVVTLPFAGRFDHDVLCVVGGTDAVCRLQLNAVDRLVFDFSAGREKKRSKALRRGHHKHHKENLEVVGDVAEELHLTGTIWMITQPQAAPPKPAASTSPSTPGSAFFDWGSLFATSSSSSTAAKPTVSAAASKEEGEEKEGKRIHQNGTAGGETISSAPHAQGTTNDNSSPKKKKAVSSAASGSTILVVPRTHAVLHTVLLTSDALPNHLMDFYANGLRVSRPSHHVTNAVQN